MLKTNITLEGDEIPVRFDAVDKDGNILISTWRAYGEKWQLGTYVKKKQLANSTIVFNNSGPAIETFSKVVNNLDDYLRQVDEVIKLRAQLNTAECRLADLRNSYYSSIGE